MIKQGWECPKCGRVYAPWVSECTKCKNTSIGYEYTVGNPYNSKSAGSKTDEVIIQKSSNWCLDKEGDEE